MKMRIAGITLAAGLAAGCATDGSPPPGTRTITLDTPEQKVAEHGLLRCYIGKAAAFGVTSPTEPATVIVQAAIADCSLEENQLRRVLLASGTGRDFAEKIIRVAFRESPGVRGQLLAHVLEVRGNPDFRDRILRSLGRRHDTSPLPTSKLQI